MQQLIDGAPNFVHGMIEAETPAAHRSPPPSDTRGWLAAAIVLAGLCFASIASAIHYWPNGDGQVNQPETTAVPHRAASIAIESADPAVLRRRAWDKIARRLAPADAASLAAIDQSLKPIERFFAEHRKGARPFAEAVLGLRGKWKYVKTRGVLGGDSDEHLAFLDEKFRQHVFDPDELTEVIKTSVGDYVRAVQGIENKLLVTCRVEIEDIDPAVGSVIPGLGSTEEFEKSYETMLQGLVHDVASGATADVGLFVGSFVAAEITQQLTIRLGQAIAARLGVSAGVLGAGATGSTVSAGLTIGIAIVIDMGIDWLMRLTGVDAASKVTAKVEQSLDDLCDLILDGDPTAVEAYHKIRARRTTFPTDKGRAKIEATLEAMELKGDLGLRRMLLRIHQLRARLREAALRKLVLQGDTP